MTIPEEAVVAGAKAMDAYWGGRYAPDEVEELRGEVTAMLEAAAPHIAAQALEDAAYTFEDLPMNKGASVSSGTYDWFELFPIQHMRDRAEEIRTAQ